MSEPLSNWIIRWRYAILAGTVIVVALLGLGGQHLRFSNDYRVYFSDDNPQLQAFEQLQNTYSKNDNVLIVLAPKDGTVFTRETLAAVEWLTAEAWRLPHTTRVNSITNFQHTEARGDELVVRDLVSDAVSLSPAQIERVRAIALAEPMLSGQLVSHDAAVTGINITVGLPGKSLTEVPEVMQAVRDMLATLRAQHPDIAIHITGAIPIDNEFGAQAQKDLTTLTPVMYIVILLVAFLILRSFAGVVATVLIITLSTVAAMGIAGWIGIELTPPSAAAPTVILTLAVAHGIHVLLAIVHGMRHGMSRFEAIAHSLKMNVYPITIATLTDVIGFMTMNFSEVPPFRDLGNIISIGVVAAYALAILFLPALMAVLPIRIHQEKTRTGLALDRLAELVIRRRTPILVASTLLVVSFTALIPRNELNDNFVKYFDESVEFRRDSDFINGKLSGLDAILYSVPAGASGGVSDPAYLATLEEFANWYRTQPGVTHVSTLTDVMKRLNKNMNGDDPAWYRVPESRELAAQYLLLYELSLPFGLDLNNQINVDKSASQMVVFLESAKSTEILGLEAQAQAWLAEHAPEITTVGSGPSVMFAHIGQRNIRSMFKGNIVALLLISAILIMVLRSLKLGLLSVIPNLAPLAVAFGIWSLFVGQVGLALSVVAVMTYGIVVDDTIHAMTKYVYARNKLGLSREDAVRYIFSTVGMAAWAMSVILVCGFLVLSFSAFELNSSMGMMTALIIALALAADFFLLPSLVLTFDRRKHAQTSAAIAPATEPERA